MTKSYRTLIRCCAVCVIGLGSSAVCASDKLLVSSFQSNRIERLSVVSAQSIDGINGGGALSAPLGMTVGPDGHLYVASEGTDQILRLHRDTGALLDVFVGDDPATDDVDETGGLDNPAAVLFGPDGLLYVSSFETDAILRYNGDTGAFVDVFVSPGSGGLDGPDAGMVFGPGGDLFVPSFWGNAVLRYSGVDGSFVEAFVPADSGGLVWPRALLFRSSDGHLLVTAEGSNAVLLYDGTTGALIGSFIDSIPGPSGIGFGPDGDLYVTSIPTNSVQRFTADGEPLGTFALGILLPTYLLFVDDGAPDFTQREEFGEGSTIPIAWGDADNDGLLDLAVGNVFGELNRLYRQSGDGTFVAEVQFGAGGTFAVVWGDYDNDGDLDMAVGNSSGLSNSLYVNQGDGTFAAETQFGFAGTVALAWGDFDNDGDLDMAVGNGILGPEEANTLYVNNGDGTFTGREEFGMGETDSVAWGDFDNDGDLDLAVGNGGFDSVEQNRLYVNNGDGTFTEREEFGIGDTTSVAWGDANNDGWLDLAVGNWPDGQNLLFLNNRDGSFTEVAAFGADGTNTLAWGDINNDGFLDLAVGNGTFTTADQNYLYINLGDGTFAEFAAFGLGSTDSLAFADFDGDGDLDMAVGNEHTPRTNFLYINNTNNGAYLTLSLVGHYHDQRVGFSNRSGVGARVSVYEAGHICDVEHLLGFRQIEATGGFTSQGSLEAEFGLPGQATVDVRIDWPGSGGQFITQNLFGVAVGQRLQVDEQDEAPAVDCNNNGLSDACEFGTDPGLDCNGNGRLDECDLADGASEDCSGNGVPDECEPDCNGNATADSCDIMNGTSEDCSGNGVPDECEPDCNDTGVADSCDIVDGVSEDCTGNGVPDECEPDCNDNSFADSCDIADEISLDCNANAIPDECDLAAGTSTDLNGNGIPDECDDCPPLEAPVAEVGHVAMNRCLSFSYGEVGRSHAVRVTFADLPAPHDVVNGTTMWVGTPATFSENSGVAAASGAPGFPTFLAARLQCDPFFADWGLFETVYVYHEGIVPGGLYSVQVIDEACGGASENDYSEPLELTTSRWGDVTGLFQDDRWSAPDDSIDFITDILSALDKFSNRPGAPLKARIDLEPAILDFIVNISDIVLLLDAFRGLGYPFDAGVAPPCSE